MGYSWLKPVSANTSGPGPPWEQAGGEGGFVPQCGERGWDAEGERFPDAGAAPECAHPRRSGFGSSQSVSSQMLRGKRGEPPGLGPSGELRGADGTGDGSWGVRPWA